MGAWGLLPFALPAVAFVAARLGAIVFADGRASDRAVGGVTLALALVVASVRVLGAVHLLYPAALGAALVLVTSGLALYRRGARFEFPWREMVAKETAPLLLVVAAAMGVAVLAARWLPVWQWDALGYHLPYVDFALVAHGLRGVPDDIPYISTYPHDVELCVIALRAMLPDDRLVDLAQLPFGIAGAIGGAGIARVAGAARPHAVAAGAAWLVVPAVFLQLPSDYVDVASAAFLLLAVYFLVVPPTVRSLLLAGVALGLYLGSKPNSPVPTALLCGVILVRGIRGKLGAVAGGAVLLVLVLGGEAFFVNFARHGNPIWPIQLTLGPIHLPGTTPMGQLLESGAAAPRVHGPLLSRVVRSWTSLTSAPVFDMRIGGMGPLFLASLPFAAVTLARWRSGAAWAAAAAAIASPDPAVARYVIAFPALVLALASARLPSVGLRARVVIGVGAAIAGAWQLAYAYPGLAGEGPPLAAYAHMSEDERAGAVGANGPPTQMIAARKLVRPGETLAFDVTFDLPYLGWTSDLAYPVVYVPDTLSSSDVGGWLDREKVRILAVADHGPAGEWARLHPEQFELLFPCRSVPCAVYLRR